jgi:hypothetical protein
VTALLFTPLHFTPFRHAQFQTIGRLIDLHLFDIRTAGLYNAVSVIHFSSQEALTGPGGYPSRRE